MRSFILYFRFVVVSMAFAVFRVLFLSRLFSHFTASSSPGGYEEIYQDGPAQLTTFKSKPKVPAKPSKVSVQSPELVFNEDKFSLFQPLNLKKYEDVCHHLDRSMTVSGPLVPSTVKAPLATPEPVEIPGDYAQVKVRSFPFVQDFQSTSVHLCFTHLPQKEDSDVAQVAMSSLCCFLYLFLPS